METDSSNVSEVDNLQYSGIAIQEENGMRYDSEEFYNMSGDKLMFVFNHYQYENTKYFGNKTPRKRTGTSHDVDRLNAVFTKLGFTVTVQHDLRRDNIMQLVSTICQTNHKNTSCVCVVVLTHGEEGGVMFAADRPYFLKEVTGRLAKHPGLTGVPKLFFVQACRGCNMDPGNSVVLDGDKDRIMVLPTFADCLILYSTVEDFLSFRETDGSWMIQEFCSVLEDNPTLDILHIISRVNRRVAARVSSQGAKQVTEACYTLTKLLKFRFHTSV